MKRQILATHAVPVADYVKERNLLQVQGASENLGCS